MKIEKMTAKDVSQAHILEGVSSVLDFFISESTKIPTLSLKTTDFDQDEIRVPISVFLNHIARSGLCSKECYIIALVYVERLLQKHKDFVISSKNVHRLMLVSLILASKMLDDFYCRNMYYAQAAGLGLDKFNELEIKLCLLMDFDLTISVEEFEVYRDSLRRDVMKQQIGAAAIREQKIVQQQSFLYHQEQLQKGSQTQNQAPLEHQQQSQHQQSQQSQPQSQPQHQQGVMVLNFEPWSNGCTQQQQSQQLQQQPQPSFEQPHPSLVRDRDVVDNSAPVFAPILQCTPPTSAAAFPPMLTTNMDQQWVGGGKINSNANVNANTSTTYERHNQQQSVYPRLQQNQQNQQHHHQRQPQQQEQLEPQIGWSQNQFQVAPHRYDHDHHDHHDQTNPQCHRMQRQQPHQQQLPLHLLQPQQQQQQQQQQQMLPLQPHLLQQQQPPPPQQHQQQQHQQQHQQQQQPILYPGQGGVSNAWQHSNKERGSHPNTNMTYNTVYHNPAPIDHSYFGCRVFPPTSTTGQINFLYV